MNLLQVSKPVRAAVACAWLALLLIGAVSCTPQGQKPDAAKPQGESPDLYDGVFVLGVRNDSPAKQAGLQPQDIIIAVNDVSTPDVATFDSARAEQSKLGKPLTVQYWRSGAVTTSEVRSDLSEVDVRTWTGFVELIYRFLKANKTDRAKEAIKAVDGDASVPPEQLLAVRIAVIPDSASPEQEAERKDLLKKLFEIVTGDRLRRVGYDYFFLHGSNAAARAAFAKYLESDPSNFSVRLNLAVADALLGKADEAEREAALAQKDAKGQISESGLALLDQVYAWTSLSKKNYAEAATRFAALVKRGDPNQDASNLLRYLYVVAKLNDRARFDEGMRTLRTAAVQHAGLAVQAVVLEAFMLDQEGKRAEAVKKSREIDPILPDPVVTFWQTLPDGAEVISTWNTLQAG